MVQSIFCVGNLAKQEFIVNGELKNLLSGSAAFAALSAKTIINKVLLISSIGEDFPQAWLNLSLASHKKFTIFTKGRFKGSSTKFGLYRA